MALGHTRQKVDIDSFTDDEVRRLAKTYVVVYLSATPVFDGAKEEMKSKRCLKLG